VQQNRQASKRNNGYPTHRALTTSQTDLFSRQGAAGINFDQYDNITVERSG
jgi:hypothetical protein